MFVLHGTKKFRDRVPATGALAPDDSSTTVLGNWYATVLFWRPQVALFVNEHTLLPVLLPLAPGASTLDRFRDAAADVFRGHGLRSSFVDNELAEMADCRLTKTQSRSVLGIMNEYTYLAEVHRARADDPNFVELSLRLAKTPCSPLYGGHVSPDRALAAIAG